ncbi:DUF3859 domain-containing protein [Photobacterium damselae]
MSLKKLVIMALFAGLMTGCSSLNNNNHSDEPIVTITQSGVITQKGSIFTFQPSHKLLMPKIGQYIGFRYSVKIPQGAKSELANKLSFPIVARMTHPKIVDPKTQKSSTVSTWSDTMYKHDKNLALWNFSAPSELVSGQWIFELLYKGKVIAKQYFTVANPEQLTASLKNKFESMLSLNESLLKLTDNGDKLLCHQPKLASCWNFDSMDACTRTMSQYKNMCQKVAMKFINKGKPAATPKEEMKEFFSYFTICMNHVRMKEANLDNSYMQACMQ